MARAIAVLVLCWLTTAFAQDMYCGSRNCYEVLGVNESATPAQIKKQYHKLSLVLHPDKIDLATMSKEEAEAQFVAISTAYEVLSKAKEEYDQVLAHPERYWRNHFNYYQYQLQHQTNVWGVIIGIVAFFTLCHYLYWESRYYLILKHASRDPRVQARIREKEKACPGQPVALADVGVLIGGWQGRRPRWDDLLVFHILFFPLKLYQALYWHLRWQLKFRVLHQPYGDYEREVLAAAHSRVPWAVWDEQLEPKLKAELVDKWRNKFENGKPSSSSSSSSSSSLAPSSSSKKRA